MITVINFADENFLEQQRENTSSAYLKGKADRVIEYHPEDIDEKFRKENITIFSFKRGYGLWIWKPYFILKAFEEMVDGEFLFYCDSGSYFVNDIHLLTEVMNEKEIDIMPFDLPLLEMQWTKKETYDTIGLNDFSYNQCLASYILIRKTKFSSLFVTEWRDYMTDLKCSSQDRVSLIDNFRYFVSHREDQSVFSALCHKYELESFRDPSQFGEWPWLYCIDGAIYNPIDHKNSPYPRILISNRRVKASKYKRLILIKNILERIGLYRPLYFLKRKLTNNSCIQ